VSSLERHRNIYLFIAEGNIVSWRTTPMKLLPPHSLKCELLAGEVDLDHGVQWGMTSTDSCWSQAGLVVFLWCRPSMLIYRSPTATCTATSTRIRVPKTVENGNRPLRNLEYFEVKGLLCAQEQSWPTRFWTRSMAISCGGRWCRLGTHRLISIPILSPKPFILLHPIFQVDALLNCCIHLIPRPAGQAPASIFSVH